MDILGGSRLAVFAMLAACLLCAPAPVGAQLGMPPDGPATLQIPPRPQDPPAEDSDTETADAEEGEPGAEDELDLSLPQPADPEDVEEPLPPGMEPDTNRSFPRKVYDFYFGETERTWTIIPIAVAGPDTGYGGGLRYVQRKIGGMPGRDFDITGVGASENFAYGFVSYNEPDIFGSVRDSLYLSAAGGRLPASRFYGTGNDSLRSNEVNFRETGVELTLAHTHKLGFQWDLTTTLSFRRWFIGPGELDDPAIPSIEEVFPNLNGLDGGMTNGIGFTITHFTTDNRFNPRRGGQESFTVEGVGPYTFADYEYYRLVGDVRRYIPAPNDNHVLALRGLIDRVDGPDIPFYSLSSVTGGERIRGYRWGRFRDRVAILTSGEYRVRVARPLWVVAFADVGRVYGDLDSLTVHDVKWALGGGLRAIMPPKIILRLDVGQSDEQIAAFLRFGQAF